MNKPAQHIPRQRRQRLTALVMTVVYLAMLCLPLVAFALSPDGKVTRECSGDCSLCGCSPASSAAGICCCAKKQAQMAHQHDADDADEPECCKKDRSAANETIIACGCPCGSERHDAMSIQDSSAAIPCRFRSEIVFSASATSYPVFPHQLTSRHVEPPVPPPQLT